MVSEIQRAALKDYARRIRTAMRADPGVIEPGLAPQFQRLLDDLLPTLPAAPRLVVSPEFQNPGVGRPDIALKRPGEPPRAFVELKAINKGTDGETWKGHDKRQFERFSEFAHWATCNFHEFRLYERGKTVGFAALAPRQAFDPERSDAAADKLLDKHDAGPALALLERLAQASQPAAQDAKQLAEFLAHSARLVRGIIKDRLAELTGVEPRDAPLLQVRQEFRDVLYSHPEAGGYSSTDFDQLFSGAFAQTLAFGLLLVREASGAPVDSHAADHMPPEHPLMRTTLQVLSQPVIADEIGAGFETMLDTVNGFDPSILAIRPDGRDPILYFYEDFLEVFDKTAKERYGVYYTPVQVVRYMVGALDRALRERLKTAGLADPQVHILDPATGTGTFLLGIAERLRRAAIEEHGPGQAQLALQGLARRMYGFELLVGPYAVAHYRLHHALSKVPPGGGPPPKLPRLGIYLADTLARPNAKGITSGLGFFGKGIEDERKEAERIRSEQPILAIIGNPPYRRLAHGENETLVGHWMDELWEDLKRPVKDAGQGNQLNTFPELSVAFWRWAIWKLFESDNAPRRGVVAFITNRKFLTGWPYAGLRKMMRERFDRIEVIDLRGDVRLGERADVDADQGVFNIQVGTAITIAIADGSKRTGALAEVTYNDTWEQGLLPRKAKLEWLETGADAGDLSGAVEVERDALEDMRPRPFFNGELISIVDCFEFKNSGVQTKRDAFVYATRKDTLLERLQAFVAGTLISELKFSGTDRCPETKAKKQGLNSALAQEIAYRPFDIRWLYNSVNFIDRPRPDLQAVWGKGNTALYAMPSGTNAGPAVWCHGLLPDYHAFRGSYGGYAFPLFDRRPDKPPYNLNGELVAALTAAYGDPSKPVTPEAVFDAILALLSAPNYSLRFAEDLEDVPPHVPFPADRAHFDNAVAIGAEIRAVETFARPPEAAFSKGRAMIATEPKGPLAAVDYRDGGVTLCDDGSGRVDNIPAEVWDFAVSGYRVLPRWLAAREGVPVDEAFTLSLRDLVGRISELLDLFRKADGILEKTLENPLSREALGLEPAVPVEGK
jgi:hypothetical protein